jgi:beta-D-xylosidase 4
MDATSPFPFSSPLDMYAHSLSSPEFLGSALNQSLYDISVLDRSLARRYASLVKLGYFDPAADQPYRQYTWSNVATQKATSLALQAAEEGLVLLKNNGVLPLPKAKTATKVAMIGPMANATTQMQGNYAGVAPFLHSPLYAAQQAGFSVLYALGADVDSEDTSGFEAAVAAARDADVVVYVGGIDVSIEAEGMVSYSPCFCWRRVVLLWLLVSRKYKCLRRRGR